MGKIVLIPILAVLWVGPVAHAQSSGASQPDPTARDRAKKFFDIGEAHKQAGDALAQRGHMEEARVAYGDAATAYIEGYRLSELPLFLYNLGSMYRRKGDLRRAMRCYRAFLATDPANPEDVADTRMFIEELTHELTAETGADDIVNSSLDLADACVLEEAPKTESVLPAVQDLDSEQPEPARPGRRYRVAFWPSLALTLGSLTTASIMARRSNTALSGIFSGLTLVGIFGSGTLFYKGYMSAGKAADPAPSGAQVTPVIGPSAVGAEFTLRF